MKIINFIKNFFSKNAGWKIASLFIAVLLWFIVMNTLNPAETKSFSVQVSLTNEQYLIDNGLAVLNTAELLDTRVEVKVKGTRSALDELSRQRDNSLKANIDFQQLNISNVVDTPQGMTLNISPKINNIYLYSYEVVSFTPSSVNVVFDAVKQKDMKITANFTGKLVEGYSSSVEQMDTDTVTVYGPASEFDKVGSVIAEVNLDNKTENFQADLRPLVYSTSGDLMTNFVVEPSYITAQIAVDYTRNLEIMKPEQTGKISSELTLKAIDWSPKVLEITGDKEILDSLSPIKLPAIELDKLAGSDIRTYEVSQFITDPRVSLKSSAPRVITVTIEVSGKDGKNITFNADEVNITGLAPGLKAQLPSQVVFTVFGEADALAKATNDALAPSVDLTGIGEGATEVPLSVTLPEGVQVRNETKIYVFITKEEQATLTTVDETTESTTATTTTEAEPDVIEEPTAGAPDGEETTEEEAPEAEPEDEQQ